MANIHGMSDYQNNNNNGRINSSGALPPNVDQESREAIGMFGIITG